MILNLRGCSGAGKSYPGFRLLDEYGPPVEEVRSTDYFGRQRPKLIAQILPGGLCLAGRYTMKKSTVKDSVGYSGGVDGFFPVEELQDMLTMLSDRYPHVLVESLMISGTYERWLQWAVERDLTAGQEVTFATLDTPLETCLARVQQRNGGKPVKEDQIGKHRRQVHRCAKRFADAGAKSVLVDHTRSYDAVKEILAGGGWNPGS